MIEKFLYLDGFHLNLLLEQSYLMDLIAFALLGNGHGFGLGNIKTANLETFVLWIIESWLSILR